MRVAVTGVGGGVGQSIMKALTMTLLDVVVFPVDIHPFSAGLYRGAEASVLPNPEGPEEVAQWEDWLKSKRIDAVFPGTDHHLLPLASVRDRWEKEGLCTVLVSDLDLVRDCRDKALTWETLTRNGFPAPKSFWGTNRDEVLRWASATGYPIIIKPRDGSASRNVHVAKDEEELQFYLPRTPNPILQERLNLDGAEVEFTCAVFVDSAGEPVSTFMARRELQAGTTYRAEVNYWPEFEDLLMDMGRALKPRGPMNVQLRLTDRGPVPFEINVRCSGTTAIRSHFNYNEPEMLLRHFVLGEPLEPPKHGVGYVFRYWNEVFLDGVDRTSLSNVPAGRLKGVVRQWP